MARNPALRFTTKTEKDEASERFCLVRPMNGLAAEAGAPISLSVRMHSLSGERGHPAERFSSLSLPPQHGCRRVQAGKPALPDQHSFHPGAFCGAHEILISSASHCRARGGIPLAVRATWISRLIKQAGGGEITVNNPFFTASSKAATAGPHLVVE